VIALLKRETPGIRKIQNQGYSIGPARERGEDNCSRIETERFEDKKDGDGTLKRRYGNHE